MRRKTKIALTAAAVLLAGLGVYLYFLLYENRPALLAEEARCRLGAYSFDGGHFVFVRHRVGRTLRINDLDGRTLLLEPGDGAGSYRAGGGAGTAEFDCEAGTLTLSVDGWPTIGKPALGKRLALSETPITFASHGDALRGKIVAAAGSAPSIYVTLVHGSERDSAFFGSAWQYILAARGYGVVVYDKRGTGLSDGKYSQDFDLLADDAAAAIAELRRLVPGSYQVGILGGSQGGWVAPLAATRTAADFVIALYGLAEGALAEDREEVLLGLREAGFDGPEIRSKALEVTAATGKVMASRAKSGWEELAAVKAKYGQEPFFAHLEGEFTGELVRRPPWLLKLVLPFYDEGTSWDYEPLPTLRSIEVDHLWVLAGDDHEAPSGPTREILLALQASRPKLDVAYFPKADHGMVILDSLPPGAKSDGPRSFTYAPGYFSLVTEWIATRRLPAGSVDPGSADLVTASGAADLAASP